MTPVVARVDSKLVERRLGPPAHWLVLDDVGAGGRDRDGQSQCLYDHAGHDRTRRVPGAQEHHVRERSESETAARDRPSRGAQLPYWIVTTVPTGVSGQTVAAAAVGISTHPRLWGVP